MAEKEKDTVEATDAEPTLTKAQERIVRNFLDGRILKTNDGQPYFVPRMRGDQKFWAKLANRKALDGLIEQGIVVLQAPHLHRSSTGQVMTLAPELVPQEEEEDWEDWEDDDGED